MFLTKRGLLLLLLAAPFLAAATWLPQLVWGAALAVSVALLLIVADWRAARTVSHFQVERRHDARLSLGAENKVTIEVRHRFDRGVPIEIRDEPPNAFKTGDLVLKRFIPARQTWRAAYSVYPPKRGDYRFGDINLRWQGPLGLVTRQSRISAQDSVKVYPDLIGVKRFDLLLRQNRLQEFGLRNARLVGQGTEFERLREYQPDDEYRHINWKATARRFRPITTTYQTERSQSIMAVLDTGRMMQSPVGNIAKLDYAINATLLLAYVAAGLGDKVGLLTFAADVQRYVAPRQGRGQFQRILDQLYAVSAQPVEPDYQCGLAYLARKQRRRALIILFTDITGGESMNTLRQHVTLLARRSLPLVVTISDPELHEMAARPPNSSAEMYQQVMAGQILRDRRLILERLKREGVETLDVPATQLSPQVVGRYLQLKNKGQI